MRENWSSGMLNGDKSLETKNLQPFSADLLTQKVNEWKEEKRYLYCVVNFFAYFLDCCC